MSATQHLGGNYEPNAILGCTARPFCLNDNSQRSKPGEYLTIPSLENDTLKYKVIGEVIQEHQATLRYKRMWLGNKLTRTDL